MKKIIISISGRNKRNNGEAEKYHGAACRREEERNTKRKYQYYNLSSAEGVASGDISGAAWREKRISYLNVIIFNMKENKEKKKKVA